MSHKHPYHSNPPAPVVKPLPVPVNKPRGRFSGFDWVLWGVLIPGLVLFLTALIWGFCAMASYALHLRHAQPAAVSVPAVEAEQLGIVLGVLHDIKAGQEYQDNTLSEIAREVYPAPARQIMPASIVGSVTYVTNQPTIVTQVQYLHLPPVYLIRTNTVEYTNWLWHAVQTRR